jgi:hypothetical protein
MQPNIPVILGKIADRQAAAPTTDILNQLMKEIPQQQNSAAPKKKGIAKGLNNQKETVAVKSEDTQRNYVQEFLRVIFLRNPEGVAIWDKV